jgi:hypothetical protein
MMRKIPTDDPSSLSRNRWLSSTRLIIAQYYDETYDRMVLVDSTSSFEFLVRTGWPDRIRRSSFGGRRFLSMSSSVFSLWEKRDCVVRAIGNGTEDGNRYLLLVCQYKTQHVIVDHHRSIHRCFHLQYPQLHLLALSGHYVYIITNPQNRA